MAAIDLEFAGLTVQLRPRFAALIAVEEELGPVFALVERAGAGQISLSEVVVLFWHCLDTEPRPSREEFGEAVAKIGLAGISTPLRRLLGLILQGEP